MNKKQEAKFEALWSQDITYGENDKPVARCYYEAGLRDANGIVEEPMRSMQSESYPKDNSAPEWVIDMIRTGNPVQCKVWDDCKEHASYDDISGYDLSSNYPFKGENQEWKHAEPIHAWKPKDGEAVFIRTGRSDNIGQVISGDGETYKILRQDGTTERWALSSLKPFDASKISNPWSEI